MRTDDAGVTWRDPRDVTTAAEPAASDERDRPRAHDSEGRSTAEVTPARSTPCPPSTSIAWSASSTPHSCVARSDLRERRGVNLIGALAAPGVGERAQPRVDRREVAVADRAGREETIAMDAAEL